MKAIAAGVMLVVFSCVAQSRAASSEESADLGLKASAAFQCAALASAYGNSADQERLFNLGYSTGRALIEEAQTGSISTDDFKKDVPAEFFTPFEGPSPDFMLGRIWQITVSDTLKDIVSVKNVRAFHVLIES